ncbi:hypothetical protein BDN72DRAFT_855220 [Pluteus cervinus]|uniref:Uncharacterized protein n=1 Tax=Pluteus cervinus TaxID=181527 RepID=A0ACD3B450_9AGAR|nr:hypothetical protein BDN72DRAFT_855220 [Pluteus cervinus]
MIQQSEATKLLSLPTELLTEVMKNMTWKSVMRARKTCRRLQDVSKSLAVWRHLVRQEPRFSLCLEQPIEAYSSDELEYFLLRRKKTEVGYERAANGSGFELRRRILPVSTNSTYDCARLVPGGRWLLISTRHGSVKYYDLSTQDPTGRLLIPKRYIRSTSWMCVDVDMNSPTLRFNLALTNLDRNCDWGGCINFQRRFEIWEVSLVVDESGRGVGLSAGHKAQSSFLQEPKGNVYSVFLVGDYLSYEVMGQQERCVFFVQWKDIRESSYPKRMVTVPSMNAYILLNDHVCTINGSFISLVSLSALTEFTTVPPLRPTTSYTPLATIKLPESIYEDGVSNPMIYQDSQHFVAYLGCDFYEIVVSDSDASPGPQFDAIRVGRLPHRSWVGNCTISLSDGFCLAWLNRGGMLLQRFPGLKSSPGHQALLQVEGLNQFCLSLNVLDMASGQVITQQPSHIVISTFHLS